MYRRTCLFVLFMCLCQCQGQSEQTEGQSCSKDGATGVCKLILDCPGAMEAIKKKIFPKTCSFIGEQPVVCCIESVVPTNPPPLPTRTTTARPVATTQKHSTVSSTTEYVPPVNDYINLEPPPQCAPLGANKTAPRTGQKAWDKCIEYQEEYVFPCDQGPSGTPVRMNYCKHNANQLVVGGINAMESEFPHMALLGFGTKENDTSFLCGGSVISDKFILTAGHCTYVQKLGTVSYALLGTLKRSDNYDRSNLYKIRNIFKHPDYAPPQRYHDIALLETEKQIRLYLKVIPACLDVGQQMATEAWATGWGATTNRGSNADTLQKVKLERFTDNECFNSVRPYRLVKKGIDVKTQICYGDKVESKDTCQGDSGGPMQIAHDRITCMYVIVGVTSFGRRCGVVGQPGIYTRVAEYVPWIESVVWP